MLRLLYILFVLNLYFLNTANSQSAKQKNKLGNIAFNNGDYYEAIRYYQNAFDENASTKTAYKLANSYRLYRNYNKASLMYKYVLDANSKKYPKAYFWLGESYKSSGKYQLAIKNYQKYYKLNRINRDYFSLKSKHEIVSCENALYMSFESDSNISIFHLDSTINNTFSEYQVLEFSDSVLLFSSLRPINDTVKYTSIYYSNFENNKWQYPKRIVLFNDSSNVSNFTIDKQTNVIYFTKSYFNIKNSKIYSAKFTNGKWTNPKLLSNKINLEKTYNTQPSIAYVDNNKYLIWVSNRNGGYGGLDLWYGKLISETEIKEAINLGEDINSIADEITPFFDDIKQTLYFSSKWLDNLGGFDIFMSKGNFMYWNIPENMGSPINSKNNDLYYSINNNHSKAYFSSNREGAFFEKGKLCCNDIFYYNLPNIINDTVFIAQQTIKQKKLIKHLIPITLYFDNDQPNPKTLKTNTSLTYKDTYLEYTKLQDKYADIYTKGLKKANKSEAEIEIEDLFFTKIDKGYSRLNRFLKILVPLLEKGEQIEITIKGYASPLNNSAYNANLSKRRIQSLINYLETYNNGTLIKYIRSNKLVINREAYGEETATSFISDDASDIRNSIYSPAAALERKIEIIAISYEE